MIIAVSKGGLWPAHSYARISVPAVLAVSPNFLTNLFPTAASVESRRCDCKAKQVPDSAAERFCAPRESPPKLICYYQKRRLGHTLKSGIDSQLQSYPR